MFQLQAEEKLRLLHEKKCKLLKRLADHGGIGNDNDAVKIESIRASIGKLSTKIRIAIKFIDSISNKLNRLRDEEFWPQIIDLIRGYVRILINQIYIYFEGVFIIIT